MLRLVFVVILVITFASTAKLPPIFQKCNRKNPDFKNCVLEAARKAVPLFKNQIEGFNFPSWDPFEIPEITIPGHGAVAVEQNFKNCKLFGLLDIKVEEFEFFFDEKVMHANVDFPKIKILCQYDFDGRVLVLPIKGTGPSTVILTNSRWTSNFTYEETKKRNKTFLKFVSAEADLEPELLHFNFENLLQTESGDQNLGKSVNQVLNDNWKVVYGDVKGGYIEVIKRVGINFINHFFSKISVEEAFD